jgi:hypothetical protein
MNGQMVLQFPGPTGILDSPTRDKQIKVVCS